MTLPRNTPLKPGKALKRSGPLRRRAKKAKAWEDPETRRESWHGKNCCYCAHGIFGPRRERAATEPEHPWGRGWKGADDERAVLPICHECHATVGRGKEAKVNGPWLKMQEFKVAAWTIHPCEPEARADLVGIAMRDLKAFIDSHVPTSEFSFGKLEIWTRADPQILTPGAVMRGLEVLAACGIGQGDT